MKRVMLVISVLSAGSAFCQVTVEEAIEKGTLFVVDNFLKTAQLTQEYKDKLLTMAVTCEKRSVIEAVQLNHLTLAIDAAIIGKLCRDYLRYPYGPTFKRQVITGCCVVIPVSYLIQGLSRFLKYARRTIREHIEAASVVLN